MELIPIEVDRIDAEYAHFLSEHLEQGNILLLSPTPFLPSEADCEFLRAQKQTDSGTHKNIAYKPHLNKITGRIRTQRAPNGCDVSWRPTLRGRWTTWRASFRT